MPNAPTVPDKEEEQHHHPSEPYERLDLPNEGSTSNLPYVVVSLGSKGQTSAELPLMVDTGANANVISQQTYEAIPNRQQYYVETTTALVQTATMAIEQEVIRLELPINFTD